MNKMSKGCDICKCGHQRWVHVSIHREGCEDKENCDCIVCVHKGCDCTNYKFGRHCYEKYEKCRNGKKTQSIITRYGTIKEISTCVRPIGHDGKCAPFIKFQ